MVTSFQPATIESPRTVITTGASGALAGPVITAPSNPKVLPWQGQITCAPSTFDTVHPACGHTADSPMNSSVLASAAASPAVGSSAGAAGSLPAQPRHGDRSPRFRRNRWPTTVQRRKTTSRIAVYM
jgi:hypothetical protein